jgi:hypothetical protein
MSIVCALPIITVAASMAFRLTYHILGLICLERKRREGRLVWADIYSMMGSKNNKDK